MHTSRCAPRPPYLACNQAGPSKRVKRPRGTTGQPPYATAASATTTTNSRPSVLKKEVASGTTPKNSSRNLTVAFPPLQVRSACLLLLLVSPPSPSDLPGGRAAHILYHITTSAPAIPTAAFQDSGLHTRLPQRALLHPSSTSSSRPGHRFGTETILLRVRPVIVVVLNPITTNINIITATQCPPCCSCSCPP